MKATTLLAPVLFIIALSSCDCKKEMAALKKENDSLKHILAQNTSIFQKQWYVPEEFKGTMQALAGSSGDYTGHLPMNDANTKIKEFQKGNFVYDSYTIRADTIRRYLNNNPKVCDLHVFQALDGQQPTIIIIGVDTDGNHVYVKNTDNKQSVFEHCQPCPTCWTSDASRRQIKGQPGPHANSADTLEPQP